MGESYLERHMFWFSDTYPVPKTVFQGTLPDLSSLLTFHRLCDENSYPSPILLPEGENEHVLLITFVEFHCLYSRLLGRKTLSVNSNNDKHT